ncbi:vacuolar ATPase assembly integral membrane protein vma21 [Leucoagaricus gongylophorus]
MSEKVVATQIQTNAASKGTLAKLLFFSISLGAVPLISYYVSLEYVSKGNNTAAAIIAVVTANIVLIAYIITSLLEDREENSKKDRPESKKTR